MRSPDFFPRGSFINEYIGEYISDDEAESISGIRYDDQKMSRLMDVVGDGKDVVRMCIEPLTSQISAASLTIGGSRESRNAYAARPIT